MNRYRRKGNYFNPGGPITMNLNPVQGVQLPTPNVTPNIPGITGLDKIPTGTIPSGTGGLSSMAKSGIGMAGSLLGSIGGGLIGGGLQSGAGNAISSIGSTVGGAISTVNPLIGGIVSGASGIIGGLTNRMFGSNINEAKVSEIENTNQALINTRLDDSSNESILNQFANQEWGTDFSKSDIGKDGWFSNKAARKYSQLKNARTRALVNVNANYSNAFNNAANAQNFAVRSTMFKNGGNMSSYSADWDTGINFINNGGTHEQNIHDGVQIGVDNQGIPNLVEEGEIIWNDYVFSNRLKPSDKEKESLKIRGNKDMTYANAAKKLQKESEERPNDPISKRGRDAMLSRLSIMQEDKRKRNEANKFKKQLSKLSPDELLALQEQMNQGMMQGYDDSQGFAFGGPLGNMFLGTGSSPNVLNTYSYIPKMNRGWFGDDGNYTSEYRSRVEDMSLEGLQNMMNNQYSYWNNPSNKGTDRWNSINEFYTKNPIYNNANYQVTDRDLENYKRLALDGKPGYMHNMTTDNMAGPKNRYFWTDDDGNNTDMGENWQQHHFMVDNPDVDTYYKHDTSDGYNNYYYRANPIGDNSSSAKSETEKAKSSEYEEELKAKNGPTWLRYAPVLGAAIGLGKDLFSKPDYSNANAILEAANDAGIYNPVSYDPIGNYLAYKPLDRDYYINKLNAQSGATRRAIINQSAGNRAAAMAGILASDYNAQGRLGDLARQAEEYNLAQRHQVEDFNRATDMFNSEAALKAGMANQEARLKAKSARLSGVAQAAGMREAIDNARGASISANLTNLFDNLGNIGIDAYNRADRDRLLRAGVYGTLSEKPQGWTDKEWEYYKKTPYYTRSKDKNKNESKYGGKLRKKRGGFTY